jgi:hypothetical protein
MYHVVIEKAYMAIRPGELKRILCFAVLANQGRPSFGIFKILLHMKTKMRIF